MSLSPADLERLVAELSAALPGAHIQKISFVHPGVVFLEVRQPGRSILLRLDTTANAHLGVVEHREPAPTRPLAIQGLWRSQLLGAGIESVQAEGQTVSFRLTTERGPRTVTALLDDRDGRLTLADAQGRLLGPVARRPEPGAAPRPPPDRLGDVSPDPVHLTVSRAAARLFEQRASVQAQSQAKAELLGALRSARKRLARTVGKVEQDRARITEATKYQQYGDLLKPMLSRLKRGATSAAVTAWGPEGAMELIVPLLPQLGPKENMERYYHLHRRLARSAGRVDDRLSLLRDQLARVDALLAEADDATRAGELPQLLEQARSQGLLTETPAATAAAPRERLPYREYLSLTGARLLVGRNARDNDALTFRHARGNDLWLHARGQTGSHVVIPGLGEAEPDGEALLDAAELAAHFSAGRDETLVEVAATRCKYVRKAKGAPPGAVTFSQERTIQLRRQPERLARLLATEKKGARGA